MTQDETFILQDEGLVLQEPVTIAAWTSRKFW